MLILIVSEQNNPNIIHFGRVHYVSILTRYTKQFSIQICIGITALKLDSGDVLILEFGQSLWLGNRMEKSLIKPNPCQKVDIKICDDPTDQHRKLGNNAS